MLGTVNSGALTADVRYWGMKDTVLPPNYAGSRFPAAIIAHAVWRYFRFTRSYRNVEELLAERGVIVTDETVRHWCQKFGQVYANELRRRRPRPGDTWHLDEVFIRINGTTQYLWRAVDQEGDVLDILVQSHRDTVAAKKFFRKLLKGLRDVPRVVITDKLACYGAARRAMLPSVEHRQRKGLNNRAENSPQPTRERERRMRRSSPRGTRSASSPPTAPSPATSARAATASPPRTTARPATNASLSGAR